MRRCDWFTWNYQKSPGPWEGRIAHHRDCELSDRGYFPNTRISENGSLIISNVTLDNDGIYSVNIYKYGSDYIEREYYTIHVEGKVPGVQEEIITRPGSDLLLPIRQHLTLNHTDRRRCDRVIWYSQESPAYLQREIARHSNCELSNVRYSPNRRILEDGSLIISNVTPENDGRYSVTIYNHTGLHIQRDYYTVHVEGKVPGVQEEIFTRLGSDLLLPIRRRLAVTNRQGCDQLSWNYQKFPGQLTEIAEHWNCKPFNLRYFPNTRILENGSLIISNVTLKNDGIYSVIIYKMKGGRVKRDYYRVHVEGENRSGRGHFLLSGVVFVLYTGLLIFMVNDLRKMKNEKNEKNWSERRTRRRDRMEMEIEPTYYNDSNNYYND